MAETRIPSAQVKDGSLTDADIAAANKDGAAGTASMRTLGTGATQSCAGDDSRLSDNRTDAAAIHDDVSAEISAVAEKTTPVSADLLIIEDSAASNAKKRVQIGNLPTGADAEAFHDDESSEISALTQKVTPENGDHLLIEDSAASNAKKRVLWSSLPGAGAAATVKVKASDETLANSTTLQADDDLTLAVGASETWEFELVLTVSEAANNPNIKLRMGASGGLTGSIEYCWRFWSGTISFGTISDFTTDTGGLSLSTSKVTLTISGTVKGTNAGTLQLEWAQDVSDADATIVHALSKLIAHKV